MRAADLRRPELRRGDEHRGVVSRFELRRNCWPRPGGSGIPFLDYIVDGRSLWEDHRVGPQFHEVPALGWQPWAGDDDAAARLVLDAPPDLGDRTSIFVCAFCGVLDCGATSVVIERDGDEIVWRDPASTTPDYGVNEVLPPMHRTRLGWVRDDGLPLPENMNKIVEAHTFREGFEAWPAELRFDHDQYRDVIVERPTSSPTSLRRRR
jgi:hypothetical protein